MGLLTSSPLPTPIPWFCAGRASQSCDLRNHTGPLAGLILRFRPLEILDSFLTRSHEFNFAPLGAASHTLHPPRHVHTHTQAAKDPSRPDSLGGLQTPETCTKAPCTVLCRKPRGTHTPTITKGDRCPLSCAPQPTPLMGAAVSGVPWWAAQMPPPYVTPGLQCRGLGC